MEELKKKIAKWYNQGLWSKEMVLNAVTKGKLSEADAKEILGE